MIAFAVALVPMMFSGMVIGRREGAKPTLEQVVFANIFKGEHF